MLKKEFAGADILQIAFNWKNVDLIYMQVVDVLTLQHD
jgi:hypothetical protein